ncbi:MAG: copper transporter [Thermoleophilaceae bacterium]
MFDFRYHALSLAAVFLALGIGIVLGVTIGDSLVSETEESVRSSLRGDLVGARDQVEELRGELAQRSEVIERTYPLLVEDRLDGRRVAIVAFGSLPDEVAGSMREAIEDAGGQVDSTSVLDSPPDERALGDAVGGRFERLGSEEGLLRDLGERIGRSIVLGGEIANTLERQLDESFRGAYQGADAVVVYRAPEDESSDTAEVLQESLVEGLLSREGVAVVGVERSDADPSQIRFYRDNDLSSVDNLDEAAGRIALVFALDGARGRFGFKDSAEEPLPEPEDGG